MRRHDHRSGRFLGRPPAEPSIHTARTHHSRRQKQVAAKDSAPNGPREGEQRCQPLRHCDKRTATGPWNRSPTRTTSPLITHWRPEGMLGAWACMNAMGMRYAPERSCRRRRIRHADCSGGRRLDSTGLAHHKSSSSDYNRARHCECFVRCLLRICDRSGYYAVTEQEKNSSDLANRLYR